MDNPIAISGTYLQDFKRMWRGLRPTFIVSATVPWPFMQKRFAVICESNQQARHHNLKPIRTQSSFRLGLELPPFSIPGGGSKSSTPVQTSRSPSRRHSHFAGCCSGRSGALSIGNIVNCFCFLSCGSVRPTNTFPCSRPPQHQTRN